MGGYIKQKESKASGIKKPSYLAKRKTKQNFNLNIQDIPGTQPKSHFKKLEERINTAKGKTIRPGHICGKYNPYEPSVINLKQEPDEGESLILEVDYKNQRAKKGGVENVKSGKFIKVRGQKRYIDTTYKKDYVNQLKNQTNAVDFMNDLSKSTDSLDNKTKKDILLKNRNRRDCSADYKFIGKSEKKEFTNKKDLRYDVLDINQKNINFVPKELQNDKDYENYRTKINNANLFGYMPEIYNRRIDRLAVFDRGRRVWRSRSQIHLKGIASKRSVSPVRSVSRSRNSSQVKNTSSLAQQGAVSERQLYQSEQASIRHYSQSRQVYGSRSPVRRSEIDIKPYNNVPARHSRSPIKVAGGERGQIGYHLNNKERYLNLKKKHVDFFARPERIDPKDEERFRPPSAVRKLEEEKYAMRKECLMMVDKKSIVVRDNYKPLNKDFARALGFVNPVKRHLRSKSPVARNPRVKRK